MSDSKVPNLQKPFKIRIPDLANSTEELIELVRSQSKTMSSREVWEFGTLADGRHAERPGGHYGEILYLAHDIEYLDHAHPYYYGLLKLIAGENAPSDVAGEDGYAVNQDKLGPDWRRWMLFQTWMVFEHLPNEWGRMLYARMRNFAGLTGDKILLLDKPDSDIWSDDERLTLKFAKAVFEFSMTDELFEAARQAWGEKLIFRYIALSSWYRGYFMTLDAIGLDRWPGITADEPLSVDREIPSMA